jgi:hypothetical protein
MPLRVRFDEGEAEEEVPLWAYEDSRRRGGREDNRCYNRMGEAFACVLVCAGREEELS